MNKKKKKKEPEGALVLGSGGVELDQRRYALWVPASYFEV